MAARRKHVGHRAATAFSGAHLAASAAVLRERADGRIRLDLARLYIDQGRLEEARVELTLARKALGERAVDVLQSRLEIRAGDYRKAYTRLAGLLRLDFAREKGDSLRDRARYARFSRGRVLDGEAYALFAVAARETGHEVVAERAAQEAEERGADMTALGIGGSSARG